MKLINLNNGDSINVIQWKFDNVKAIKKFINHYIDKGTGNVCYFLGLKKVHLHYVPTLNNSLTIYYTIGNQSNKHHIITIPAHDYIMFNSLARVYNHCIKLISVRDVINNYAKPRIVQREFVNNKSHIHYISYQWNGSWASIPHYLSDDFHHKRSSKILTIRNKFTVKPESWVLCPTCQDVDDALDFNMLKVATPDVLDKDYHTPKPIKLPKYVFTVTESTGDYSDTNTCVIGSAPTYTDAKKIVNKARKLYSNLHEPLDPFDNPYFEISVNKTRGFTKDDLMQL